MPGAGRQILAFVALTAAVIAVVEAGSRTPIFPMYRFPGGAVFVYGLSMTLIWLMRQVVPFAFPPCYYRLRPFENDGRLYRRLGVVTFKSLLSQSRIELLNFSTRLSPEEGGSMAWSAESARLKRTMRWRFSSWG